MGAIWSIILAAGESKRMGFPKMLLPINGISMLETVIVNIEKSNIDQTLVVLGANREAIFELITNSDVKHCYNERYKEGMLSSVKCGFSNLPSDFEAVLVFQGDQPLITHKVINIIIDRYRLNCKRIVIPVYKKRRGHPILIDSYYRHEIDKLEVSEGLRSLAYKFPEDVLEVEIDDPGILRDFDTYEDYRREINQTE